MHKELTDTELDIYSRQIVLSDIGYDGQLKLKNSKVCIVGVGGLGSPTALKLAGMGIGYLRIVDRDVISRSDLHRQYLYSANTIGQPKVEVAYQNLRRLNPNIKIDPVPESLNSGNAEELISGMDIVVDGLDRPEPRYIVNRTCNKLNVPYIFGAAIEAFGNVSTIVPGKTSCLECFMEGIKDEDLPVCGVVGVHPSVLGIVSSVQVSETVCVLTGRKANLFNKLLYVDLRSFEFNIFKISPLKTCKVCGSGSTESPTKIEDRFFEETCARDGRRNFVLSPKERIELNLEHLVNFLREKGYQIQSSSRLGVSFKLSGKITACLLRSGIMNANAPPKMEEGIKHEIFKSYKTILVDGLGFSCKILPEERLIL
jgi:adenylyltransferase/sulfurtransferase